MKLKCLLIVTCCVVMQFAQAEECKNATVELGDYEVRTVNFRHKDGYGKDQTCGWTFKANTILIQIRDVYIGDDDALYIYDGDKEVMKDTDGAQANNKAAVIATSGTVTVQFISGSSSKPDDEETGFVIHAIAGTDKSGFSPPYAQGDVNLTASSEKKILTSPGFPNKYPVDGVWMWNIGAVNALSITIKFIYLDVTGNKNQRCFHFIEIYGHGMESNKTKLCTRDDWEITEQLSFSTQEVHIKMTVDKYDPRHGFAIQYSADIPEVANSKGGGCGVLDCIVPIVVIVVLVIVAVIIVVILVRKNKSKKYETKDKTEEKTDMPLTGGDQTEKEAEQE